MNRTITNSELAHVEMLARSTPLHEPGRSNWAARMAVEAPKLCQALREAREARDHFMHCVDCAQGPACHVGEAFAQAALEERP